jgi:hypothetical protein
MVLHRPVEAAGVFGNFGADRLRMPKPIVVAYPRNRLKDLAARSVPRPTSEPSFTIVLKAAKEDVT